MCSHIKTRLRVRSVRARVRKVGALTHTPSVLGASQVFAITAALAEQDKASEKDCADHGDEEVYLLQTDGSHPLLAEIRQKDQKTGQSLGFALETEPNPTRKAKDEDSDRRPSPETDWTSRECSEPQVNPLDQRPFSTTFPPVAGKPR